MKLWEIFIENIGKDAISHQIEFYCNDLRYKKFWFWKSFIFSFRFAKVANIVIIFRWNCPGISILFSYHKDLFLVKNHNYCCLIKFVSFKHDYRLLILFISRQILKQFSSVRYLLYQKKKEIIFKIITFWFSFVKYLLF